MRLFWREAGNQWHTSISEVAEKLAALTAAE